MADLKHVYRLRYCVAKVLPAVYDDTLSYIENLGKVIAKMNELIEDYNVLIDYYNSLDELLETLNKKIAELDENMQKYIAQINQQFEDLKSDIKNTEQELTNQVNKAIADMNKQFDSLENDFNNRFAQLKAEIEKGLEEAIDKMQDIISQQYAIIMAEINSMKQEIESNNFEIKVWVQAELQKFLDSIPDVQDVLVVDPETGKLVSIQFIINQIYDRLRVYALTAEEYDSLRLTAYRYDHWVVKSIPRGLTAFEYDYYAKKYLYYDDKLYIIDPMTGYKVFYAKVIEMNTDLLKQSGSLDASQYDGESFTASYYDSLNVSAFNYDWKSNALLDHV